MPDRFAEIAYQFAFLNELIAENPTTKIEIPSSREEAKTGADTIATSATGHITMFQFKRAEYLKSSQAGQWYATAPSHGRKGAEPYYRFKITEEKHSEQHNILIQTAACLDVYYAAPKFHTKNQLYEHARDGTVRSNSIVIHARQMPYQRAGEKHSVTYLTENPPGALWHPGTPRTLQDGYRTGGVVTLNADQFMEYLNCIKRAAQEQEFSAIPGETGSQEATATLDTDRNIAKAIIEKIDGMPSTELVTCVRTLGEVATMLNTTAIAGLNP